jgi:hypothetical protein
MLTFLQIDVVLFFLGKDIEGNWRIEMLKISIWKI